MADDGKSKRSGKSRQLITEHLKKIYSEAEQQELPDSLKDLLERLKRSDEEGDNSK
jgi:hypothetical protein